MILPFTTNLDAMLFGGESHKRDFLSLNRYNFISSATSEQLPAHHVNRGTQDRRMERVMRASRQKGLNETMSMAASSTVPRAL